MSSENHSQVMNEKTVSTLVGDDTKHINGEANEQDDVPTSDPDPDRLERWNSSGTNIFRYFASLFSFIVMGMNDAAYGVSPPRSQDVIPD